MAILMAISTQNHFELRYIHRRRRVRVAGEAHMNAQRGRHNPRRRTRRAITLPRLAAALLTAALAAALGACSGGGSANIANRPPSPPAPVHFPLLYVKRPVPPEHNGTL